MTTCQRAKVTRGRNPWIIYFDEIFSIFPDAANFPTASELSEIY